MAKRREVQTVGGIRSFYSVETPIGYKQSNKRKADVELVQFFLKQFFDNPKNREYTPKTTSGLKTIVIDGIVGPQTIEAIRLFQKSLSYMTGKNEGFVDKIISVPNFNVAFEHTHCSTMWKLNMWFLKWSPLKEKFDHLEEIPDIRYGAYSLYTELCIPA